LWNAAFPVRLQYDLEQMQDVGIADPSGHLGEQHIVPNAIKIGLQIQIDHVRLPRCDRVRDPENRLLS